MDKNHDTTEHQIWKHVHRVEDLSSTQIEGSSELQDALNRSEHLHYELKHVLPLKAKSDEDLEKDVLSMWEREKQAADPAPLTSTEGATFAGKLLRLITPQRSLHSALALAACSLLLFGVYNMTGPAISVDSTRIVPYTVRSIDGTKASYSDEQLLNWADLFQSSIQTSFVNHPEADIHRSFITRSRNWDIQLVVQELDQGDLLFRMQAYWKNGEEPALTKEKIFKAPDDKSLVEFGGLCGKQLARHRRVE